MAKPKDKCCKNCVYSRFPRDKRGRRMMTNYAGVCRYKMPDLPSCVSAGKSTSPFGYICPRLSGRPVVKVHVTADGGKDCEVYAERSKEWELTYAAMNEDFDFVLIDGSWSDE